MNITRRKATGIALIAASAVVASYGITMIEPASAGGFQAGNILADGNMYTSPKMNIRDIQKFLDKAGRGCVGTGNKTCLRNYRAKTRSYAADRYCPRPYVSSGTESAAEIIFKAAYACQIAPQVLMVTLQKEQSLITAPRPDGAYKIAMGYGCPDSSLCDSEFYGLQNQLYHAARQFQIYRQWPTFTYAAGRPSWIKYNPRAKCGGSKVYVQNQATAALYNYTPYQPNPELLNSFDTRNSCSTYGNYNFFNYYSQWFGDPRVVSRSKSAPVVRNANVKKAPTGNTGTRENTAKARTVAAAPVTKAASTPLPMFESAVLNNNKISSGQSIVLGGKINFSIIQLKAGMHPKLVLNGKEYSYAGKASKEGRLSVQVPVSNSGNFEFSIVGEGKTISSFKLKVVAPEPVKAKQESKGKQKETPKVGESKRQVPTQEKPKQQPQPQLKKTPKSEVKPQNQTKPEVKEQPKAEPKLVNPEPGGAIFMGEKLVDGAMLEAGNEITVRINGVNKNSIKDSDIYFHSPEKVQAVLMSACDAKGCTITTRIPAELSNGNHGLYISAKGKEVSLLKFQVYNPPVVAASPVTVVETKLADTGSPAMLVLLFALGLLIGGVYMVVSVRQERPIRVNC